MKRFIISLSLLALLYSVVWAQDIIEVTLELNTQTANTDGITFNTLKNDVSIRCLFIEEIYEGG